MSYAVVEDRGKQYKVSSGDVIEVDYIENAAPGQALPLKVVMTSDMTGSVKIGSPYVNGIAVKAVVTEPLIKADKVIAVRWTLRNSKSKRRGHRQKYTAVKIESIA